MRAVSTAYRSAAAMTQGTDTFKGVDLYHAPDCVDISRSPDAVNMIRDVPGKVRKRMGYHKTAQYDGAVNGIFTLRLPAGDIEVVHAGTKLYRGPTVLYSAMKNARSTAFQLAERLFILDGQSYLCYDGDVVLPVNTMAYVPRIVVGRAPSGGGTPYERYNLLSPMWTESFLSDGTSATYQLSFDELDGDHVEVKVMTAADEWTRKQRGVDFTLDTALGTVTFVQGSIPGASPVDGADNVRITARKVRADYVARIAKCDLGILYGVNAAADRLFVTGNPDYINYDWVSELDDGTYFPVTSYSVLGMRTRIGAYSIVGGKLAAHKQGEEDGRNILLRTGTLDANGKACFPVTGTMQGPAGVCGRTVAYLHTEPLFLSDSGIFAVTTPDAGEERYAQGRSMFIDRALERETDRADVCAVRYGDFYVLALGGKLYVLDSLVQAYEKNAPYSTHQYEAYVLEDIPARVLSAAGGKLRFGTADGKLMEFYTDPRAPASYTDDGQAIAAHWDTPLLCGTSFYRQKNLRYLALRLSAAVRTGVKASVQRKGRWSALFEESIRLCFFDFSAVNFSRFTFSTDSTPKSFGKRIRIAKEDKVRFRFSNDAAQELFGLSGFSLEYTQGAKIK